MNEDLFQKAYNYAVYLLSLKLRTVGELKEKMRLKKYNDAVATAVIKLLAENRYLDDQRYAEVYLENLKAYKNFGFYGIKKKLMEKRLPADIIESVLRQGLPVNEEIKIAQKFLKKQKELDKQKIVQKFRARGFRTDAYIQLFK